MKTEKKILVALDGSEQSCAAVRYLSKILPPGGTEVVLLNIMVKFPESFWDVEQPHAYQYKIINLEEWESQQRRALEDVMAQCYQVLVDNGIPEDQVTLRVQNRQAGIAQDIINESQMGYDAVIVGRKGLSELKDLVLGSVAQRLVQKLHHVPVWVVGGAPATNRLLICLDSSEGAMGAVDYVAEMVEPSRAADIILFHAFRGHGILSGLLGTTYLNSRDAKELELVERELKDEWKRIEPVLHEAKGRLVEAGFDAERITFSIAKGVKSRSGAIIEEAKREECGTIVVGRRGLSRVQEFFMGRVSSKVIQMAKEQAVWVIN
ncbi:MAG: universal stress protein [Acidobacteriota bacterium]